MGIQVKMGRYGVDEEAEVASFSARRAAAIAGLLVVVPLVILFILDANTFHSAARRRAAVAAQTNVQGTRSPPAESVPEPSPFLAVNWSDLEPGNTAEPIKSLQTDLDRPEWEGREVYKNLKAMAVYEVKPSRRTDKARASLLKKIFKDRG